MRFKGKSALSAAYVEAYVLARGREVAYLKARYRCTDAQIIQHFKAVNKGEDGYYIPTPKQEKKEQHAVENYKMVDKVEMEDLSDGYGTAVDMTISFVPYDPDRYARERMEKTPKEKLVEYSKLDPVAKKMIRQYKDVISNMLNPTYATRPSR
jgi:hypothetical protein